MLDIDHLIHLCRSLLLLLIDEETEAERSGRLLRATWLVSGRAGIRTQHATFSCNERVWRQSLTGLLLHYLQPPRDRPSLVSTYRSRGPGFLVSQRFQLCGFPRTPLPWRREQAAGCPGFSWVSAAGWERTRPHLQGSVPPSLQVLLPWKEGLGGTGDRPGRSSKRLRAFLLLTQ